MKEAVELAEYVRDMGVNPEQVQDFIPTPGTLSTCMYYTGLDPHTKESVYVPHSMHEKAMQRALIQYRSPRNHGLVEEALRLAHREDLIGYGPKCLIRPRKYVRADPIEKDGKPSKMSKGRVRRSGMKSKTVVGKEAPYKDERSKAAPVKGTSGQETSNKGAQSKEPRYKGVRSIEAPHKALQGKESRYKDARATEAPYKGAQGKSGRYKDSRSIETPMGAPAKEGRFKDVWSAEKAPYTGAKSEVGRSRAERSLVTPYKAALGKAYPVKDSRGKDAAPYKGAPSKAGGYKGPRSVEVPYKGARSNEVAPTGTQSKEAPSEGIQEKGKARFWRGADNQIHMGKRKHRGGKKK